MVFSHLQREESQAVEESLSDLGITDLSSVDHIGGLGIEEKFEKTGLSVRLLDQAQIFALARGKQALVGHTGNPSEKYPQLKSLFLVTSKFAMQKLPLREEIFYPDPVDLQKIWLFKHL